MVLTFICTNPAGKPVGVFRFFSEDWSTENRLCGRSSAHLVAEDRSYSDHDPQKRFIAGTGRNDIDDSSFGVEFRPDPPKCRAGFGSSGEAVFLIYLCVWLLHSDGVLFRVP
jgi:hypothetical protein